MKRPAPSHAVPPNEEERWMRRREAGRGIIWIKLLSDELSALADQVTKLVLQKACPQTHHRSPKA